MLAVMTKKPTDHLDYDVKFDRWIPDGDVITTVVTDVSPLDPVSGVTVPAVTIASPVVKVWLDDGVLGETYTVSVRIATQGGRDKTIKFQIRVTDKDC